MLFLHPIEKKYLVQDAAWSSNLEFKAQIYIKTVLKKWVAHFRSLPKKLKRKCIKTDFIITELVNNQRLWNPFEIKKKQGKVFSMLLKRPAGKSNRRDLEALT